MPGSMSAHWTRHGKPRSSRVSGFLRRELGRALQLRYTPELQFIADDSIAHGAHILEVLRKVEQEDESRGSGETEEGSC